MTVTESLPAVDAVRRSLDIQEQALDGADHVQVVLTLRTNLSLAPAQLWPLLTRPHELSRWFGPVSGELREGGRFEAPGGATGRILQVEEPHCLGLSWEHVHGEGPLQLRLDPEDDGTTQLVLRRSVRLGPEELSRTGPGVLAIDWEIVLLALAAHTDGWQATCLAPVPVPTPQWLRDPQGERFVRAWSVRWAAEAVAAGIDEATARRGEAESIRRRLEG